MIIKRGFGLMSMTTMVMQCFKCQECIQPIMDQYFGEIDGKLMCHECLKNKYATRVIIPNATMGIQKDDRSAEEANELEIPTRQTQMKNNMQSTEAKYIHENDSSFHKLEAPPKSYIESRPQNSMPTTSSSYSSFTRPEYVNSADYHTLKPNAPQNTTKRDELIAERFYKRPSTFKLGNLDCCPKCHNTVYPYDGVSFR